MSKEKKQNLILTVLMFVVFGAYTALIKTVDVAAIGPEGSKVGFASINAAVRDGIGVHEVWYKLTEVFGIIAILVAVFFAFVGLLQLIKGKSLKAVSWDIYSLAITYVATGAFYVLFEKLVINYRPIIVDVEEGLEASFPSSHTMLIIAILGTAIVEVDSLFKNEKLSQIIKIVMAVIIALTVVGRLVSGVHWLTDIVGGMILGGALVSLFMFLRQK